MSEENVEIVQDAWKAYGERGIDGVLDFYAADCVCEAVPEGPEAGHAFEGWEGVRDRDVLLTETFEDLVLEPVEFIDAGEDLVVSVVSMRGRGKGSGVAVDGQPAFVYKLRGGKVVWDRAFTSRSQALEAAGLEG